MMIIKSLKKRWVFRQVSMEGGDLLVSGKLFLNLGPTTINARSPGVSSLSALKNKSNNIKINYGYIIMSRLGYIGCSCTL